MKKGKITKKQLKEDELLHAVMTSTSFLKEHLKTILISIAVVVAVFAIATTYLQIQESNRAEAGVLSSQGRIAYLENNYDEALKHFTELTEKYSSTESGKEGFMYLGNVLFQKEQYDEAREAYKECMSKHSKDDLLYISAQEGIAACLEGQEKYAEAARAYEDIANTHNNDTIAPRNLLAAMRAYEAANNVDAAKKVCQQIIDKYPDSTQKQEAENRFNTYELMAKTN